MLKWNNHILVYRTKYTYTIIYIAWGPSNKELELLKSSQPGDVLLKYRQIWLKYMNNNRLIKIIESYSGFHYWILLSCEIAPKTGSGYSAVRQTHALWDSLTAPTATLGVITYLVSFQNEAQLYLVCWIGPENWCGGTCLQTGPRHLWDLQNERLFVVGTKEHNGKHSLLVFIWAGCVWEWLGEL